MTQEEQFFNQLLEKTKQAFTTSATYKKNGKENWNYAICDTPIQRGKGVFFGLNWGGDNINAQSVYPEKHKERDWNFITHSRRYFRDYFDSEIEDLNYSNLCFFRSPNIKKLVSSDWEFAIPLFREYIEYIEPPWTLMLGKPSPLWNEHLTEKDEFGIFDEKHKKTAKGYLGKLFGKYPFGAVPHPQARVSKETRQNIWERASKSL